MMLERPVDPAGLVWARGLLGERGDEVLWSALVDERVVAQPEYRVQPANLAAMLWVLANAPADHLELPRLVWTLPPELGLPDLEESYSSSAIALLDASMETLTLVSPFMEAKGVGRLLESLLGALKRGLHVTIITHGATDLSSYASNSLEELRREAQGLSGILAVYSARDDLPILLHSKLVVSDNVRSIVGSANITGRGFGENLEAGVMLGEKQTSEITRVIAALRLSGLLVDAFTS
jgi:phosphatidylserine/phosphatidylglycerophosphate/cardiolipin synthase-like enzyme